MGNRLSPKQYLKFLKMSHKNHLLVEGRTDKKIFEQFFPALFRYVHQAISQDDVLIESAESLIRGEDDAEMGPSNRERVEYICAQVLNTPEAEKLVGFVDREYRGFERGETLQDTLNGHRTVDRVVWSRGHSIENYMFDTYILSQSLRHQSKPYSEMTEFYSGALTLFESLVEPTIRLACAFSLVAVEDGEIEALKKIIDRELLKISSSSIILNLGLFKQILAARTAFATKADHIIERFLVWQERVNRADFSCISQMCHGHIGIQFIRVVFELCIVVACQEENLRKEEMERALQKTIRHTHEGDFSLLCSTFWIYESLMKKCDYPREVLLLLGLTVP